MTGLLAQLLAYLSPLLYVRLSPEQLTVRNPKTGVSVSEVPDVAIVRGTPAKIVAVGNNARSAKSSPSVQVLNPFAHPRSMVSDFTVGQQVLKAFVKKANPGAGFTLAPRVVFHLLGDPAGGFTQVEIRAFHEMALGAGASQVKIWQGCALSDEELLSGRFPAGGNILS